MSDIGYRTHKILNATDGYGQAIGMTIDPSKDGNTAAYYKHYADTLAANLEADVLTDLGRKAHICNVKNDDTTNSFSIAFSHDGTNYGDSIEVKAGESHSFNYWFPFAAVKLVYSASAPYRLTVL